MKQFPVSDKSWCEPFKKGTETGKFQQTEEILKVTRVRQSEHLPRGKCNEKTRKDKH